MDNSKPKIYIPLNVAKELLKFLFLYATFMVGFATSFHILRGETYPEYFGDPLSSFMTTFAMMIGELNYVDLVTNVSCFLYFKLLLLILESKTSLISQKKIKTDHLQGLRSRFIKVDVDYYCLGKSFKKGCFFITKIKES